MQFESFYSSLHEEYISYLNSLDKENLEPVLMVSGISVEKIRLLDSGLVILSGTCDGKPATIFQYAQNINFAFTSRETPADMAKHTIRITYH